MVVSRVSTQLNVSQEQIRNEIIVVFFTLAPLLNSVVMMVTQPLMSGHQSGISEMTQHTGKVSVAIDKIRCQPSRQPSTFWAVMIEARGVVLFHEIMAETGLVGKKATGGAYDEGARGFLCTEKTRRIGMGRTQHVCVIIKHCELKLWKHGLSMHSFQDSVGRQRCIFVCGTEQSTSRKKK